MWRRRGLWFGAAVVVSGTVVAEGPVRWWLNNSMGMHLGEDFAVQAKAKNKFVPSYPLPENAEYAGQSGCTKPPRRRRMFVAHMFGGSTKRTLESHKNHLLKYKIDPNADFIYVPSICYLDFVQENFPDCVELGVQNFYPGDFGNFTGEITLDMAKDLGATYVLIGSIHRRVFLGETDKFIRAKVERALRAGMKVLIFINNPSGECDDCSTEAMVTRQLDAVMPAIAVDDWQRVAIACEPIFCKSEDDIPAEYLFKRIQAAQKMCKLVRDKVADRVGEEIAQQLRILYSGDLCHGNAPMFLTQEDVDGAVFCPRQEDECFINIVNAGLLVERREKMLAEKNK